MQQKLEITTLEQDLIDFKSNLTLVLKNFRRLIKSLTRLMMHKLSDLSSHLPDVSSNIDYEQFFEIKSYNTIEKNRSWENELKRNGF